MCTPCVRAPALQAAAIERRGPYALRHTFATEALAAGVSIFELARLMGTSVAMTDRTYGHLARDSEAVIRARLEARFDRLAIRRRRRRLDENVKELREWSVPGSNRLPPACKFCPAPIRIGHGASTRDGYAVRHHTLGGAGATSVSLI